MNFKLRFFTFFTGFVSLIGTVSAKINTVNIVSETLLCNNNIDNCIAEEMKTYFVSQVLPYQIDATVSNPFDDEWQQKDFAGSHSWQFNSGDGVNMNAYNDSCNAEDWLISPSFNLQNTNSELLSFTLSRKYSGSDIQVLYSVDYDGVSDPKNSNWQSISTITDSEAIVDDTSLQGVNASTVFIAFLYETNGGSCADWTLSNFSLEGTLVSGSTITNIVQTPSEMVTSNDVVSVSAEITDNDGVADVVLNWGTASGNLSNIIDMDLDSGNTYVVNTNIPEQPDGTTVYYEIEVMNNNLDITTSSEQQYTVDDSI